MSVEFLIGCVIPPSLRRRGRRRQFAAGDRDGDQRISSAVPSPAGCGSTSRTSDTLSLSLVDTESRTRPFFFLFPPFFPYLF